MLQGTKRDSWGSKWGFILACIGSAVGMGNIWLFPARVSAYGGATFLIPYLIFVVIIGSTGVIGEMSFGRATRSGPVHAFGEATRMRFGSDRPGKLLGLIPVLGSLALAIGYSVVTGSTPSSPSPAACPRCRAWPPLTPTSAPLPEAISFGSW